MEPRESLHDGEASGDLKDVVKYITAAVRKSLREASNREAGWYKEEESGDS
jgi:hypothetical protein